MFFGKTGLFGRSRQAIRRVLIVEDEPLLAFDNEHALILGGYDVVATVDRMRAAEAVLESEGGVDLLVTDVRLRGQRTGLDLAAHAHARGIAVLFASATCPQGAHEAPLGWLAKPFAPHDLVRAVHGCDRMLSGQPPGRLPAGLTLFPLSGWPPRR